VTPVPFDLPVRTSEAGALARLIYEHGGTRPLSEDLRNRLGIRATALSLETIRPYFASLERDPIHPEAFFMAVDGLKNEPLLMRFAPASTPSSGLFPKAILIGRLRVGAQETVINAVPFSACDRERIHTFAWQVNPAFLPKAQGSKTTLSLPVRPGVFDKFRTIAKPLGLNVACVTGDLDTILWEAIRSGWREGYSAESDDTAIIGYSRYILQPGEDLTGRLEQIARARVPLKLGRMFDWELRIADAARVEETERILEDCKAAAKPAQYLGFESGKVPQGEEWLAMSRRQNIAFSVAGLDDDPDALRELPRRLGGRFNYRAGAGNPAEIAAALFG
jgi:hypothetical protein